MLAALALSVFTAAAPVEALLLGVEPGRAHRVPAGGATTFVIALENDTDLVETLELEVVATVPDWQAELALADERFGPAGPGAPSLTVPVPPGETHVVVTLRPPAAASGGAEAEVVVSIEGERTVLRELRGLARVSERPKVYFVALDGCGANYLHLDRLGQDLDAMSEPLMPHALGFLEGAADLSRAVSHLPTGTDPDHLATLTGSWPGTLGIHSVNTFYAGTDADGEGVILEGSPELLRTGADGAPIRTLFHVLADPASGGAADSFSAFLSGKEWVGNLLRDDSGAVDVVAGARSHPAYFSPPRRSRLGDPVSDTNPLFDREGTNPGPRWLLKRFNLGAWYANRNVEEFPDDDWISESAARLLAVEDPDALYVLLADCDTGQHLFGAADAPREWTDPGTPDVLWDDVSRVDPRANRDAVLDIVHEADRAFGVLVDALKQRGAYESSYVVLLADHGLVTLSPGPLDVGRVLADSGFDPTSVERVISAGQLGFVYLVDGKGVAEAKAALEAHEVLDPTTGQLAHPFIVMNRGEMDSGIDAVEGLIAEDGIAGNRLGELYSEWSIDFPVDDNSKVRWPDLFVFNRSRFQNVLTSSDNLGGAVPITVVLGHHGSVQTSRIPLALNGPGIVPGSYQARATLADVAPTLYRLLGLAAPEHVNGRVLEEILAP